MQGHQAAAEVCLLAQEHLLKLLRRRLHFINLEPQMEGVAVTSVLYADTLVCVSSAVHVHNPST